MTTVRRNKLRTLILSGIAVVAIVLLSAGISGLELLPGRPFSLEGAEFEAQGLGPSPAVEVIFTLGRVLFVLAWLLLPAAIIYLIKSPEFRKRVLKSLLSMLLFFAIVYLFMRARSDLGRGGEIQFPGVLSPPEPLSPAPTAEFVADPSRWLVLAASLALAVLLVASLVGVARFFWRRRRRPVGPLGRLARDALQALEAGADLKNTVIRCYFEMARVLDEQRGIRRQQSMTPREFERRLEEEGLPGQPVRQLTRLFEEVRYGTRVPGEREERQAIASLRAIVEACGSPAERGGDGGGRGENGGWRMESGE
ncbi:MAG TPA: DUF4129 domain-containing protein [Anaerolineae bacterium]|nr:DUF4129 domain-containing protein [Anaerolineae bacterium]